ncbi:MAG: cytochrome c biogenesis protein ResB [Candidatus Scalindua rubra]|uniref:ResB-like domain-containing protein n=1 Tax=Candidatus Scalindua brodae TaxID=237368 RepID=A0A0B0ELC9_9BACT|nr:MAG: hypothetical protein SCABRO_00815 [Candidatus Scalindua brodae]MBZ0108099.1 cytochrome c biogenesis protein ResB [Candidatus Scalindua rubra]TWU31283.1 Cytochrome c biogenesis protein Ccs1 [Candidatus Brocadiaceae bacterium S225]
MAKVTEPQQRKSKNDSKVWEILCSVKLAVIIIVAMAVACILGTVILQQKSPEEYVDRYGAGLAKFFSAIQLTDIFHSYWFSFLLILLCVNLACCTIKRWRNKVLMIGFLVTHISIILILIGCVIDLLTGVKGGVNVYEGKSVDYYLTRSDYQKVPLGFQVFCDDFIIERHPPKYKLITYVKDKDKQKAVSLKVGKRIGISGTNYAATVKELIDDAEVLHEPINVSDKPNNPALYIQLSVRDNVTAEGWLLAKDRNWYNDTQRDLKIDYVWADSDEAHERLANAATKSSTKPTLEIRIDGTNIVKNVLVEKGNKVSIEGTDYVIEIKEFALDYSKRLVPLSEQELNNPAVMVEISGPQGKDSRWSFSKYPDYQDKAHKTIYKDVKLLCTVPEDFSNAKNRVRIVQNRSGKQTITYIKDGKVISTIDWVLGQNYDIADSKLQIRIAKYFPSHGLKKTVVKSTGGHEGHNHGPGEHHANPAILIEMEGPRGKYAEWVFAHTPPHWYPDKNFAILYEQSGMEVKDYKSILRVVENGKTMVTKTIEVNDALKYKGFVFYQSSYDPEGERYTGLQVTKNPGLIVVYTGFILLCLGIVFIFYVKPFLRQKLNKGKKIKEYYSEEEMLAEHIE